MHPELYLFKKQYHISVQTATMVTLRKKKTNKQQK